jgi:mRNA interferase MazF
MSLNLLIWKDGMNIRRGEIYLATLDAVVGKEISKTRPVVVISNDKNNEFSATVTILPLTSKNLERIYPFEVFLSKGVGNVPKDSKVKTDQIRTLDKSRLISLIRKLEQGQIIQIEKAIKIHLELS